MTFLALSNNLDLICQTTENENIPTPTLSLPNDEVKEVKTGFTSLNYIETMFSLGIGFDCMYNILRMSDKATKFNDNATGMGNSVYLILQLNILKSISKDLTLSVGLGSASFRPHYQNPSKDLFSNPRYIYEFNSYLIKSSLDYNIGFFIASLGITSNIVTESKFIISNEIEYMNDKYIVKVSNIGKFTSPIYTFNLGLSKKFNVTTDIFYFPYLAYDVPLSNFGDTKIFGNNNELSNYKVGMYILFNI